MITSFKDVSFLLNNMSSKHRATIVCAFLDSISPNEQRETLEEMQRMAAGTVAMKSLDAGKVAYVAQKMVVDGEIPYDSLTRERMSRLNKKDKALTTKLLRILEFPFMKKQSKDKLQKAVTASFAAFKKEVNA